MPECTNHPGKEGMYRCGRCRKYFCLVCVELIDDKAYCFECLKEIVKESREETKKSLTVRVGASSLVALMIAIVSLSSSIPAVMYLYKYSMEYSTGGIYEPPSKAIMANALFLVIGVAFLVLSAGLATTKSWAYRYGLVISAVTFIIELIRVFSYAGGIEAMLGNSEGNANAFFIIMFMGSFVLFLAILGSRKELLGW